MTTLSSLSIDEAKKYIYAIDFTPIIHKMVHHLNGRRSEVEKACELYRNFLFLQKKYGDKHMLPPSEEIDEFWHNHILDTAKYRQDCEIIFGRYLDHYPYFGIDEKTDLNDLDNAFKMTQELHLKEFGYIIEGIRRIKVSEVFSNIINAFKAINKEKT